MSMVILSKDSVTVAVDAVVYFRISNATISISIALVTACDLRVLFSDRRDAIACQRLSWTKLRV
ncbi:hypothetical protein NECAME_10336 [Necator americanus]|uniref:Uncharacterized protein n=1 Tax=Necator americanus TaxID=51031 RepID=W2T9E3_NECAM|nr:hypothetical protein NECAME_10336 [Necator americanus]ETN78488.1 hypothetical protein NECAME_10336 [Necator americanus]